MNIVLFLAGILALLVGFVHSILGEVLIFNKLREGSLVPNKPSPPITNSNLRILWATWHIASFFGFALAGLLIHLSMGNTFNSAAIYQYTGLAMLCSGLLVLFATRGKHPGWLGLCGVAILCWLV